VAEIPIHLGTKKVSRKGAKLAKEAMKRYLSETQGLFRNKKLNRHSSFGNPLYCRLFWNCRKYFVLFAQNSIVKCLKSYNAFPQYLLQNLG